MSLEAPGPVQARLPNRYKLLFLGIAAAAILLVAWVCMTWGFPTGSDGSSPGLPTPFVLTMGAGLILSFVPLIIPDAVNAGRNVRDFNAGIFNPPSGSGALPDWVAGALLWPTSLVLFWGVASLVQATGGAIESPFAQMPIILVVLGPYVSSRKWTPLVLLVGGLVYYAGLLWASPSAIQLTSTASRWVYYLITVLSAGTSVGFIVAVRIAQQRKR